VIQIPCLELRCPYFRLPVIRTNLLNRLLRVVEDVSQVATTTVLTVVHGSHEGTSSALAQKSQYNLYYSRHTKSSITHSLGRTLAAQTLDLAIAVDLVVLEDGELGLLALVLDLLGRGVDLLLALLGAAAQPQHQVQRRLLLDVVVRQRAAVLELLAGEDQALLVWRDALLVCGGCVSIGLR